MNNLSKLVLTQWSRPDRVNASIRPGANVGMQLVQFSRMKSSTQPTDSLPSTNADYSLLHVHI